MVDYQGSYNRVKIICKEHGEFEQLAKSHLRGNNCLKCSLGFHSSKGEKDWLDTINPLYRNHPIRVSDKKRPINVDGFDPDTNTVYEYYGDFWHGNPKNHNNQKINSATKTTFGKLYHKMITKEKLLKKSGYKLITIWESDWLEMNYPGGRN